MMSFIYTLRTRLGPLWWYSGLLFIAMRLSDAVNAFIGIWLVPKYIPQDELGAVLPLTQVGSVLGLPMAILLVPFTKFLNVYATREEYGKVKRLLRDAFVLSGVLFVVTLLYARLIMPMVFERMRVAKGSLGFLLILAGVLTTVAPVFVTALQALKKFNMIAVLNLLAAPVRLCALLVTMPIRAISGYFVGQCAPSLVLISLALLGLKDRLGQGVKSESYWEKDWRSIIKYTLPVAVFVTAGTFQSLIETFVIRHRLSDLDSAGYYLISRFAEIGGYAGFTLVFVLFPLAVESHERGSRSQMLLWQSMGGALLGGCLLACVYGGCGRAILRLSSSWRLYVPYVSQMTLLTVIYAVRAAGACFVNFEMACGRFRFVFYYTAIALVECVLLYVITGFSFFVGRVPLSWIQHVEAVNPCRLEFVLLAMLSASALALACSIVHVARRVLCKQKVAM